MEKNEDELSINTLMMIHEALMLVCRDKFGEIVLRYRKTRREVRQSDPVSYEELVFEEAENKERLISESIEEVVKNCKCSLDLYN